jgi:hypothetical protein
VTPPVGIVIAPIWRRAVAVAINTSIVFGAISGLIGAAVGISELIESARPKIPKPLNAWAEHVGQAIVSWGKTPSSPPQPLTRTLISGALLTLDLDRRNPRWPGARFARLRRVDRRTGGPLSVRNVLVRNATSQVQQTLTEPLYDRFKSPAAEKNAAREALKPELIELAREHAEDPREYLKAAAALYHAEGVIELRTCLWPILVFTGTTLLPIWLTPRRQSLPDLAAGIVIVVDDRPATRRGARLVD